MKIDIKKLFICNNVNLYENKIYKTPNTVAIPTPPNIEFSSKYVKSSSNGIHIKENLSLLFIISDHIFRIRKSQYLPEKAVRYKLLENLMTVHIALIAHLQFLPILLYYQRITLLL